MIIIVLLICISLLIALVFLGLFWWTVKSGQYDDVVTPSIRMLFEEENQEKSTAKKSAKR
ncbi:MAG: cbb3-type cytochrome oxidase assembly protein CcoS [Cyclobacteriaceae bacterium]|jgi:cbb3-type cytochrome oxidase maturation protein|nr:cbb3-type cytochrome oxidase assembly protein CcoS [Cyclobacteriaceae bacterium]